MRKHCLQVLPLAVRRSPDDIDTHFDEDMKGVLNIFAKGLLSIFECDPPLAPPRHFLIIIRAGERLISIA